VNGPVEVLYEDFETGNLGGWLLTGPGEPWEASTESPYQGTFSARAMGTGVSQNSYIEKEITQSCTGILTFEYYRMLVGLDGLDDFAASYYDNGWIDVEHLGDAVGRESSYSHKNFEIPSTATKIRFMCECGGVSEKCFVDNVKLLCQ
jgi:hypothetical protein